MKYFLLSLFIPCSIIAGETPLTLDNFDIRRDGNKITMSAWVWKTDGLYSVEKNMEDSSWLMERMVSTYYSQEEAERTEFQPVENEPEVFELFKKEINAYQRSQEALQKEEAKSAAKARTALKRRNTLRSLFLGK